MNNGRSFSFCLVSCLAFFASELSAAPPTVTAMFPAGCQVGQSVEVAAQGVVGDKPQAWISRDGIKIEFAEAGNKFKVIVAPEAVPGVAWIRFYNAEGASSLRPFVIGTLSEVLEKEPNNSTSESQRIEASSVVVNGVLEKSGDCDTFAVTLKGGQTLVASLLANQTLGSPMDGVLQIVGPKRFVLEHNEDTHGLDPQVVFKAPEDGEYRVRLFAFPSQPDSSVNFHGAANYIYRLTLTTGPFVDHVEPMAIPRGQNTKLRLHGWNLTPELSELPINATDADSVVLHHAQLANTLTLAVEPHPAVIELPSDNAAPQLLAVPVSITGHIAKSGEVDLFRLPLVAKQSIVIRTDARAAGSPIDPLVRILNPDGSLIQEVDDGSKGDFDPDLAFTAPADGEYRLAVTDRFGAGDPLFFYRVSVVPSSPDFELRVAADSFVLTTDKPLEIPVTVDRQRGFDQDIDITATGLPEKVMAELVTSAKTGDTAKSVKLILKGEPGVTFSGPLQLTGRTKSEPPVSKFAAIPLPATSQTTTNLWLTVVTPPTK